MLVLDPFRQAHCDKQLNSCLLTIVRRGQTCARTSEWNWTLQELATSLFVRKPRSSHRAAVCPDTTEYVGATHLPLDLPAVAAWLQPTKSNLARFE